MHADSLTYFSQAVEAISQEACLVLYLRLQTAYLLFKSEL